MTVTKLSKKSQMVVPKNVRQRLKLAPGAHVSLYPIDDNHAILVKYPEDPVKALKGLGKDVWKALGGAQKYIEQERNSWEK